MNKAIVLIGAALDCGSRRTGCRMGPDALRVAGLAEALEELGHAVDDAGNVHPHPMRKLAMLYPSIHRLEECAAWVEALQDKALESFEKGKLPVFMGGDHLMSAGTVAGARRAAGDRPLFVLWLDAHADFHTLQTTQTGNLHGTPVAYFTGQAGFEDHFPSLAHAVEPSCVTMMGIRSVDGAERQRLAGAGVEVIDMRTIDESGIAKPLRRFLERVEAAGGDLHVSLDVDFLDPSIAPAVGTTVPGGATFREAHLAMEMLCDSDLVTSVDLAELNPFLDERGQTARIIVDLAASLFGKRIMDRPTRSF